MHDVSVRLTMPISRDNMYFGVGGSRRLRKKLVFSQSTSSFRGVNIVRIERVNKSAPALHVLIVIGQRVITYLDFT